MKKLIWPLSLALLLCLFVPRSSRGDASIGNNNPTGVTGEFNGSITTGGSYDPYTGNAKRFVDDLTVTGSIGAYPLKWTRILNTRGISGPFGDGGGWSHNYIWGLGISTPSPNPPPCGAPPPPPAGTVYYPDGREVMFYREFDSSGLEIWEQAHLGEPMGDRLVHIANTTDYDLKLKDGGRVEFRTVLGRAQVAKYIVDPYGQVTTLDYITVGSPPHLMVKKITEPGGRYLWI
ncbi:MAG TPA: hypothetical protein VNT79_09290, partial [Phycisphaerae bacterium]|nr:hypothetical protein [Phycisphaerae bacterium]